MCNDAEQKFFLINIPAHNKKIFVKEDVSLADALRAVGIGIETPCGGHGLCGGCLIRVLNGELDILDADREKIPNSMLKDGYRLACRKRKFHTSISIEVPQRKRKIDLSAIPQNVSGRFAFSVDIGTTTIAVSLLNADTGAEAGSMSFANPQDEYGADVISRVSAITNDPEILQVLRKMTVESLNDGFKRLLRASRVKAEDIQFISIAGNSIMEHIILGISPVPLSVYPFELVERFPAVKTAAQMGFIFLNNATVKVFPMAGANLGGDAVAGIFYLDLDKKGSPRMLIDIGTNVEIVLSKQEGLFATSSPAGPAFEGGEITFGMRAITGAIESVEIDGSILKFRVRGGGAPEGICGSGLIKLLSELLDNGVIAPDGRIRERDEILTNLGLRVELKERANAFILHKDAKRALYLTQNDVRQVQLAKAALRTGIDMLLEMAATKAGDISSVLIAGAFGSALEESSMFRIGMLPQEFRGKLVPVGDAALAGAKKCILNINCEKELKDILSRINYLELSREKDFNREFVRRMNF